jgi:hypothetical protein
VERDPELLVVLLGVRTLGGHFLPKNAELFKGMKSATVRAAEQRLLQEATRTIAVTDKKGKTKEKPVAVLEVTPAGEDYLRQFATKESLEAAKSGEMQAFRSELQAGKAALRQEILSAVTSKTKTKSASPDLGQVLKRITTTLDSLAKQVADLEKSAAGQSEDPILARVDKAFDKLLTLLGSSSLNQTIATRSDQPATAVATPLKTVLRSAYERLCRFVEFEDGLVEIPRLYHEARKTTPTLSLEAFHREIDELWSQRELELKILNEVRTAKEPDKGIWRNDSLYYFVYWRKS